MTNLNSLNSIEYHILSEATNRALLLTGSWGCGKTYYWNNEIVPIVQKHSLSPIYVSLHGVSTLEQLEAKFLTALLPEKMQKKFYKNAINIISKKLLGSGIEEFFKGVKFPELKNAVVCYDDLERCSIKLDDLWGFINNYVEQIGLKTIIIANEEKLNGDYREIREKNISRSINYEPNIEKALENILLKFKSSNKDFYDAVLGTSEFIIKLMTDFKIDNLRTLILYLENLRTIFNHSYNEYGFRSSMFSSFIITNEFALGNLSSDKNGSFYGLDRMGTDIQLAFVLRREKTDYGDEEEPEKGYDEIFYERYLVNRFDEYHFSSSIFNLIVAGHIEPELIKSETHIVPPEQEPEHIFIKKQLLSFEFRALENDEFESKMSKLLKWVEEGIYPIYDYAALASSLNFYKESNLIDLSTEGLKQKLLTGVNIAFSSTKFDQYSLDNILAFPSKSEFSEEIRQEIVKLHNKLIDKKRISYCEILTDAISKGNHETFEKIFTENNASPIFIDFPGKEIANTISTATNNTLFHLEAAFEKRYGFQNLSHWYNPEHDTLSETTKELDIYLGGIKDTTVSKFLITSINQKFKRVVSLLQKS